MQTLVNVCTKVHLARGTQAKHSSGPFKSGLVKSLANSSCITAVLRHSVVLCSIEPRRIVEGGGRGHEDTSSLVDINNPNYLGRMFSLSSVG